MSKPKQHEHKESGTMERMGSSQLGRFMTRLAVMGALAGAGAKEAAADERCPLATKLYNKGRIPKKYMDEACASTPAPQPPAAPAAPAPSGKPPKPKKPKPAPPPATAEKSDSKGDKKEGKKDEKKDEKKQESKKDGGVKPTEVGTPGSTEKTPEIKAIEDEQAIEMKEEQDREKKQKLLDEMNDLEEEKKKIEEKLKELEELKKDTTKNAAERAEIKKEIVSRRARLKNIIDELHILYKEKPLKEMLEKQIARKEPGTWEGLTKFIGDHMYKLLTLLGLGGGGTWWFWLRPRSKRKAAKARARALMAATGGGPGAPTP